MKSIKLYCPLLFKTTDGHQVEFSNNTHYYASFRNRTLPIRIHPDVSKSDSS